MSNFNYCLPENVTPEKFLTEYWQKKPLLIKQGLPQLANMFHPDDIIGLSLDEAASSRLITQEVSEDGEQWHLQKAPLNEQMFSDLPNQWTVLVQNIEQWSPEVGDLWRCFDFIPQWQRDDVMVSYAPKGGSVGKHYDDYDVFLAQAYGTRRWQLGKYCNEQTEFIPNQPIRIFNDMGDIIFDEVLEPGDVLYVPPKLSHYGVAQDDCLTFSFGFRRPNIMQVLDTLVDTATTEPSMFIPLLLDQKIQSPGELKIESIEQIKSQLLDILQSETGNELITLAISEVVSKREYELLIPDEVITVQELNQALNEGGLIKQDYSSRLVYTSINNQLKIYANGQQVTDITNTEAKLLKQIADGKALSFEDITNEGLTLEVILLWLENSWVWVDF